MWGRIAISYVFMVGVIGGTGYMLFDWFTLGAVAILAVLSAVFSAIALMILSMTGRLQTGGSTATTGSGGGRRSKGARNDR